MESMLLLRWGPRKVGIAQNPQDRSHPSAIFTYAHGLSAFGLGRLSRSKTGISSVDVFGRELKVTGRQILQSHLLQVMLLKVHSHSVLPYSR